MASANFSFLEVHDARLVTLGGFAEQYFRDDPSTAIVKLRQFAELMAKLIAAHHATYRDERETFEETLRRLGDPIVAYQKQAGYVGYGKVTSTAVMVRDFMTDTGPLLEQPLTQPGLARGLDDPKLAEYAVGIDWINTVPITEAKRIDGMFANQNIVCKLRDTKTVDFLKEQLGVSVE